MVILHKTLCMLLCVTSGFTDTFLSISVTSQFLKRFHGTSLYISDMEPKRKQSNSAIFGLDVWQEFAIPSGRACNSLAFIKPVFSRAPGRPLGIDLWKSEKVRVMGILEAGQKVPGVAGRRWPRRCIYDATDCRSLSRLFY